jgi:hypothetical protein
MNACDVLDFDLDLCTANLRPVMVFRQIGVGEAGGLKKLLGMAQSDYPMAAAAAAKALGGLVTRSRVMQESLLGAEGATVIVQLLDTKAGLGFAVSMKVHKFNTILN